MALLTDSDIRRHCTHSELWFAGRPLISPFSEPVAAGVSYGLTSVGYDIRLDNRVMVFNSTRYEPIDPKLFKDEEYKRQLFDTYDAEKSIVLPGHSYALVQSLEYFSLPARIKGRCVGKSTYARCGVIVNTTPLEPEWHGRLTIEVSNSSPRAVKLWVGEGIAQLEFELLEHRPERTYADKCGKYQGQTDVTPARTL